MDALDRTLQPTRRVLGDVDPAQPLDLTHPLLKGVQGFWLPLPHLTGGKTAYDLRGRNLQLVDFNSSGASWQNVSPRPYPVVNVGGSNVIDSDGNHEVTNNLPHTIFGAYRWSGNNPDGDENAVVSSLWGASNSFLLRLSINGSVMEVGSHGNFYGSYTLGDSRDNDWHFYTLIDDGSEVILFFDGEKDPTVNTSSGSASPKSNWIIGGRFDGGVGDEFVGDVGAAGGLDRAMSDAEAKALYNQWLRGYPDLLNRRSSVGLLGGGGGPAADTVSLNTATALADGFEPTITATANTVSPGTAQATAQGFSATVTATQNTVSVGTAQATAQGFAPTITADPNTIAATTGQATVQGFNPTISEGAAGDTLVANLGTAQAQGFAPSISTNPATVTLGLGQAPVTGFDPDVVADPSEINTGQGQAPATGFNPTITTNARTVATQLGTAQAEGFEPAVVDGTVGVATTMEIEARPLYEIDVEAKPLYRIRLFVKEQLP